MELRNRTLKPKEEEDINNKKTKTILQPNDNFLQLTTKVQKNIINSFKEIQLQTIEERREINNKIMNTLEIITKQTNNFEETRKKTENQINKNTIILILFSIALALSTAYVSLELGKIIVTSIVLLPFKLVDLMGQYTLGYLISYHTNILTDTITNTITNIFVLEDVDNIEKITSFYITFILSFIYYTTISVIRFVTNISTGQISILITPMSLKSNNTNNINNTNKNSLEAIKNICETIQNIYSIRNNEINIQKSIQYEEQ